MQPSDTGSSPGVQGSKFARRRRRRDNEIGQILLRNKVITPKQLREALKIQGQEGGQVGAILRRIGACDSRAIAEALIEQVRAARARGRMRSRVRDTRENPSMVGLQVPCRPSLVVALLLLADLAALSLPATLMWWFVSDDILSLTQRGMVMSLVPLCVVTLFAAHLYAVTPPSPPDEIRLTTTIITGIYLGGWIVSIAARVVSVRSLSHGAWLFAWLLSIFLVPLLRGILRWQLARKPWWGQAVVVVGAGRVGRAVVKTLLGRPQLGLRPVAVLDDDPARQGTVRVAWGESDIVVEPVRETVDDDFDTPSERSAIEQFAEVEGVPVLGGLDLAPALAQRLGLRSIVIAMPEMNSAMVLGLIERYGDSYTHVLVIPDLMNLQHFGAPARSLGGVLGLEVQRQLMHPGPRFAKRLLDIAITTVGLLFIWPILATMALIVKLDSKGSVFFRQKRLGQDGVRFEALKFRTMHADADRRLKQLLESDPGMRAEYDTFHKLTKDPRVTRAGRFLRKYSLDELPQLWNVLKGEMSLVGPRPYLEREIPDMDQKEAIVLRVKPGVTGIWQVTTRNESTFEERVDLDVEYVRNWSPWLDIYILARTVPVVIGGTGS
ncbi:MAG TPA: exopolysaccharide biosynthesis polyprenyl glycosylphosphotransferase [Polyangiaceae bacterium]